MKAAVLGAPIAHSLSPVLHRAAYAALGLAGWSYQAIECDEAGLPRLLESCEAGWAGLSLTMPLKRAVLPLADWVDPVAAATGSANTVVFARGARHAYNTDVAGMIAALREAAPGSLPASPGSPPVTDRGPGAGPGSLPATKRGPGASPGSLPVMERGAGAGPGQPAALILGGGATACSALAALRELGLDTAGVAVRDPARAAGLLAAAARLGMRAGLRAFGEIPDHGPELLISTVPARAADFYAERLRRISPAPRVVFDVVYHPWPTALAAAAREAGAITVGGFELLLHQAARQVELMTGRQAPVGQMRAAGLAELAGRPA